MRRLAHRPGGIPDAIRRRDPALVFLPLFVPAMFLACIRLAAKVDVVHGNWSGPGLVGAIAARLMARPALATLRGSDVDRAKHSRVFRWILHACLSLNSRTIVVSEQMQRDICQQFPRYAHRIEFIPNGVTVDTMDVSREFRTPVRLITISNLIESKKIDVLLHALVAHRAVSGVFLRIIGDGPERKRLESLAQQLDISQCVEFFGQVPPDEIQQHLAWADVFVFASESEGRPNVILEAMAAGLPIVAADIPGTRELLLGSGILVSPGDAAEFSRAISFYLDDPSYAISIGHQARQSIVERGLSWEHTGARYGALYRDLAKE